MVIRNALLCLFVFTNVRCCVKRCYPARRIGGGPKTPSMSLSSSASLFIAFMIKVWHFRLLRQGMFVLMHELTVGLSYWIAMYLSPMFYFDYYVMRFFAFLKCGFM